MGINSRANSILANQKLASAEERRAKAGVPSTGTLKQNRDLSVSGLRAALLSFQLDTRAALQLLVNHSLESFEAIGAAIALKEQGSVICAASAGMAPAEGVIMSSGPSLSSECFNTGKIVRCDDSRLDARIDALTRQALGFRSIIIAPIADHKGVLGIFEVLGARPNQFDDDAVSAVKQLCQLSLEIVQPRNEGSRSEFREPANRGEPHRSSPGHDAISNESKQVGLDSKLITSNLRQEAEGGLMNHLGRTGAADSELSDFMPETIEMLSELASELGTKLVLTPNLHLGLQSHAVPRSKNAPDDKSGPPLLTRRVRTKTLLTISAVLVLILLILAVVRLRLLSRSYSSMMGDHNTVTLSARDWWTVKGKLRVLQNGTSLKVITYAALQRFQTQEMKANGPET